MKHWSLIYFVFTVLIISILIASSQTLEHRLKRSSIQTPPHRLHFFKPRPHEEWSLNTLLRPAGRYGEYRLTITRYPSDLFKWSLRKDKIQLILQKYSGEPVQHAKLYFSPGTPDLIEPSPDNKRGGDRIELSFHLDRNNEPSGMLVLQVKAQADIQDLQTKKISQLSFDSDGLYVYLPIEPSVLPAVKPGQQFILVANDIDPTFFKYLKNQAPVPISKLAFKVLTISHVDLRTKMVQLSVEGSPDLIQVHWTGGVLSVPNLYPLIEDKSLKLCRQKYLNHTVWGYGGISLESLTKNHQDSLSFSVSSQIPVRITKIVRVYGYQLEQPLGASPNYIGERQTTYISRNPLLVQVDVSDQLKVTNLYLVNNDSSEFNDLKTIKKRSYGLYTWITDQWEMERIFSLVSMDTALHKYPVKLRKAALENQLCVGMPAEMVVWVMGFPAEVGTLNELKKEDCWRYDTRPPFDFLITFKNGKVSKIDSGPDLP